MIKVAEMFAGVGGFRLGLEGYGQEGGEFFCPKAGDFETVWANQWEPPGTVAKQFAWRCYEEHFGEGSCVNEDVENVIAAALDGRVEIPDFDLLVGGFPCQDYSVAKPAPHAKGIEGKKGVLWWSIQKMIALKEPRYVLLENVDRLLKSPTSARGRDFAIMLCCFAQMGYSVEWRVINAADYGMPQRRRRVYIFAEKDAVVDDAATAIDANGIFQKAFPAKRVADIGVVNVGRDPYVVSKSFGTAGKSPFENAGCMSGGIAYSAKVEAEYAGVKHTIRDIMAHDKDVPESFFVEDGALKRWIYLKGPKKESRTARNGHEYVYSEGPVAFPDDLDKPARTILTSEGGKSPSRMKHVVRGDSGRLRRLVGDELDALQTFPRGWTRGMSDGHRAFCMGNALVVEIPHRIGVELDSRQRETD